MTQRCMSAFAYGSPPVVYAGGRLVADDDPILTTHRHLFEPVEEHVSRQSSVPTSITAAATETASASPGELRRTTTAKRRAGGRTDGR